jgi:hypothetical protein
MKIVVSISSSLGQRGNEANLALVKEIAETENYEANRELIENLNNKDKRIQAH